MVTPRRPNETDAEYLARLAADDDGETHTVALAPVVDGLAVDTLAFDSDRITATVERNPTGIRAAVFATATDGDQLWHYIRAAGSGYEVAYTHVWRSVPDGRPGNLSALGG